MPVRPIAPSGPSVGLLPSQLPAAAAIPNAFAGILAQRFHNFLLASGDKINWREVLNDKTVINSVTELYLGVGESFFNRPEALPFRITLANNGPHSNNLVDVTNVVVNHPADLKRVGYRPISATNYVLARVFDERDIQACFDIPTEVFNELIKLRAEKQQLDMAAERLPTDMSNASKATRLRAVEKAIQFADDTEARVTAMATRPAINAKFSLERGMPVQMVHAVEDAGFPYAMACVVNENATSIMDTGATPGDWVRSHNLQRELVNEYIDKTAASAFLLAKRPRRINDFVRQGRKSIQRIGPLKTPGATGPKDNIYITTGNVTVPVDGVIYLPSEVCEYLDTETEVEVLSGRLSTDQNVYYRTLDSFMGDRSNQHVIMAVEDNGTKERTFKSIMAEKGGAVLSPMTKRMTNEMEERESRSRGLFRLTEMAKAVMADPNMKPGEDNVFFRADIDETMSYVMVDDRACLLHPIENVQPRLNGPENPEGRSPSLTSYRAAYFHTTLGDMDRDNTRSRDYMAMLTGPGGAAGGPEFRRTDKSDADTFSIKSAYVSVPGINSRKSTFKFTPVNHMMTALANPTFYDADHHERCLNQMLTQYTLAPPKVQARIRDALAAARNANDLVEAVYDNWDCCTGIVGDGGAAAEQKLNDIELALLFDIRDRVRPGAAGQREFELRRRNRLIDLPLPDMTALHNNVAHFCASGVISEADLRTINARLITMRDEWDNVRMGPMARELTPANPEAHRGAVVAFAEGDDEIFTKLINGLKASFGKTIHETDNLNMASTLFSIRHAVNNNDGADRTQATSQWLLFKYCVAPVISKWTSALYGLPAPGNNNMLYDAVYSDVAVPIGRYAMYANDAALTPAGANTATASANAFHIATKTHGWSPLERVVALMLMFTNATPMGFKALTGAGYHPMVAVDFVMSARMHNARMLFTKSDAYKMVVEPGDIESDVQEDGTLACTFSCKMHAAPNTLGHAALVLDTTIGKMRQGTAYNKEPGDPLISSEFERTAEGTLQSLLAASPMLNRNKDVVREYCSDGVNVRAARRKMGGGGGHHAGEEFVAMVRRPAAASCGALLLHGINQAANRPLPDSKLTCWETMIDSRDRSTNTYASKWGGFEQLKRVPNDTPLGSSAFRFVTTNSRAAAGEDTACCTTRSLEYTFNLNNVKNGPFTPAETRHITATHIRNQPSSNDIELNYKETSCAPDRHDVLFRYGMSVCCSSTFNPKLIDSLTSAPMTKDVGQVCHTDKPYAFTVRSPYTPVRVVAPDFGAACQ